VRGCLSFQAVVGFRVVAQACAAEDLAAHAKMHNQLSGKAHDRKSNRYMFVVSAIVCDGFFVLALECFV